MADKEKPRTEILRLWDLPKGATIKVEEGLIRFDHIDGMYSYCIAEWIPSNQYNILHLAAYTPLRREGSHYVFAK